MTTEHTEPAGLSDEGLPELRGMFERILCVARSSDQKPVGNIELAHRLMNAVVSWDAQRQPVPPVPEDVQELVELIRQIALAWEPDATLLGNMTAGQLARAAELLSHRHPQPVPVRERLPGVGDCDAEGRCWLRAKYQPDGPTWRLTRPASISTEALRLYYAEWLPAHALPLMGEVEG